MPVTISPMNGISCSKWREKLVWKPASGVEKEMIAGSIRARDRFYPKQIRFWPIAHDESPDHRACCSISGLCQLIAPLNSKGLSIRGQ